MADTGSTPRADEQLEAIAHLDRVLTAEGVPYWLFGGWAVDFWAGRVTRVHDDVDVAAFRADYDAIGAALRRNGWLHTPVPDEVAGTRYRWRGADVEFTFVETDGDGHVVIPMAGQTVVWSAEPFGDIRRELKGVTSRTIPLALLRAGKSSPRQDEAEAAKDRADFAALPPA